jgi:hypothetical protein
MLDTLMMILAIMVSADERREKKRRREENIGIVGNLEGATLDKRKTADLNVKANEGRSRATLREKMNRKLQGNSTQRKGL